MNYEEMSDFEINQAVTCEVHQCHDWAMNKDGSFYHCGMLGESYVHQEVIDYCNNPSDAWPIIIGNCIVVTPVMGCNRGDATGYQSHGNSIEQEFERNIDALRAAMIVFLMMQGEK